MGLLNFLFGSNKTNKATQSTPHRASEDEISYIGDFITIPSIGFFGPSKKSCSGEWVICWADSDETGHRGGHRDKGHGRYILYNVWQKKVVLQGKLERPNSGSVSNNGILSIEDWHFGSELSGTLHVFSSSGVELTNRRFSANIYNSDLSVNGRYAICQTANAPAGEDGNRLTVLDVDKGAELFSIEPATGWADQYEFNEDLPQFGVVIKDIGTFNYDAEGNLIDAEKFKTA
ncbi:MAG: hypothetical protein Q8M39_10330 [Sulfuricurvum sp.]|nr:hypothetical protein [Methylotenera sp.]MDP2281292.1 hypothetical protein [Methylotenera sp.]MDP3061388.1 hypothetical protein [Methylotenera sp.]MDP3267210.1 hypothetical protein [Sulfuricurvum sp.]